ncbi:MAG: cytochrome c [Acidimicrobiia bacterium]|nr:cytochrome c [Acidimicrobiia bacterium]
MTGRTLRRLAVLLGVLALLAGACAEEQPGVDYLNTTTTTQPAELDEGQAIAAGADIYSRTCAACHGPDATGVQGLGKNLVGTEFVNGRSAEELAAFIAEGRPVDHPDNETGIAMPPRGGNPSLTDRDLLNVALYLQSLG